LKKKIILFIVFILIFFLIPSIDGYNKANYIDFEDDIQVSSNNLAVKIIRPKSGHLYLFDIFEIPIPSQSTIIIGDITCVAEQVPVYPYAVKWKFIDWRYENYKFLSTNYSSSYWRYTYSNFNFGDLQITASFENTAGTVMSSDSIITKKFL
jgi:hypothetical protein